MSRAPRFSIVTPVYKPQPEHLRQTIDSVLEQTFEDWEWIIVDDASKDAEIAQLLGAAENADSRIHVIERVERGHIVASSNDGLAKAQGEWIVLLDHDDLLLPDSLEEINQAILDNPGAGYVYTDEDKVNDAGEFSEAFQKPDWSPERLRHQMYLGHLSALRHDLVRKAGGFHEGFAGSQDHDLALRVTEIAESVIHVPKVLYHWRVTGDLTASDPNAKDYATEAGIRAVQEHLHRVGRDNDVVIHSTLPHTYKTLRDFRSDTRVSVIIPTRGTRSLVWGEQRVLVTQAVRSLLARTTHANLEIVVVYDTETPDDVLQELRDLCGKKLVERAYEKPFNFSEKYNFGYLVSTGDILVFLNDDMEIRSHSFIESLCAPLEEADVGMTGANLTFADGRTQHAGVVTQGAAFSHAYLGFPPDSLGHFRELVLDREVSGLTGACIAIRRSVFEEVGGFTMGLPSNFNDVDFGNKVRAAGYRLLWLADVRASHFESLTRTNTVRDWEIQFMVDRWGKPKRDAYMPYESQRLLGHLVNRAGFSAAFVSRLRHGVVRCFDSTGFLL